MSTIMVVDDDREMGRLMKTLFELGHHRVIVTPTYQDILPVMRQALPDAVLMDVRVQGQETIDLVRQVRQEARIAHIPVVMTSGADCRPQCLEAGADGFVMKPFLPDELVDMIVGLVDRRIAAHSAHLGSDN